MTGSWTMDIFIIGCIVLIVVPASVCLYKDIIKVKTGENK